MHLREGEFSQSHTDFFEAFKNYDESGSPRSVTHTCKLACICTSSYKTLGLSEVPCIGQHVNEVCHQPV